ncbi:metal-dependent hydrolase [Thermanaerosceptrum fracticalcis]|uniref:metal-dependent hydrolase n=1 Tax=Thermanaerosceptrum fracticalcis TaxID=1712410 RepID=UPI00068E1729|nr:metal-dependent hydrolase [Thermanaerosceptrum fracticalcis]
MTGPTHLATGILITASLTSDPKGLAIGMVASLLPDIDEPGSMISRKIPIIPYIISLLGHRTITHSLIGLVLFSGFLFVYAKEYLMVGGVAYLSHLILDTLTPAGVPWFYPLGRNYSLGLFRTGGLTEALYLVLLFVAGAVWGPLLFKPYMAQLANLKRMLMF